MKKIVSVSLVSILLASCSFIPDFSRPDVPVPERWKSEAVSGETTQIPAKWWTLYQDDTLNALMDEALTQNLDLRAGFERVNQARSALRIAGAPLLPSAAASLGAERARTNPAVGSTTTDTSLTGGLAISYDLDLFGSNSANVEAARAALSGQQYEQKSLKLVIMSEIAHAYFGVITSRERVRIAEDNLKNSREILRIIQVRVDTGLDSDLELAQQRVAVSSSEAALASIRQQEATYQNALAVLLGRAPQTFDLATPKTISEFAAPVIAPEQPSVLLERRPDIHAVEQSLVAANANIGVARAAFFPSINLGGTASVAATSFGDPATTIFALASSLTAPIFTGGALEGGLANATSQQRELVETYRKTVLTAFREVEDAMAATRAAESREVALKTAMESAGRAYDISRKRYDVGTIDFQTLLDTQAALLTSQDAYAQSLEAKLTASVDLVKALGGGWDAVTPAPVPEPVPQEPVVSDTTAAAAQPAAGPVATVNEPVAVQAAEPAASYSSEAAALEAQEIKAAQ
ncbi:MAG TPA: efflux transporter outer membrane subunit [Alphaproteobacteria bacterium]|nr:efflux transporter outer membrane subunit [Alphaproteobacteria bacterium]HNS43640.1 efflux transporter outer membrane subunit [Alphaproteobacteria bacterium]